MVVSSGGDVGETSVLVHQGWLHKKQQLESGDRRVWRPRWCLLVTHWVKNGVDVGPALRYYAKQEDDYKAVSSSMKGGRFVVLDGCAVKEVSKRDDSEFHFVLRKQGRNGQEEQLELFARTAEEREGWIRAMRRAIDDHEQDLERDDKPTRAQRRGSIATVKAADTDSDEEDEDDADYYDDDDDVITPLKQSSASTISPLMRRPKTGIVMHGLLKKKGSGTMSYFSRRSWKTRYFELVANDEFDGVNIGPTLRYYENRHSAVPISVIALEDAATNEREMDWKKFEHFAFAVVYPLDASAPHRELAALTAESRHQWRAAITSVVGDSTGLSRNSNVTDMIRMAREHEARASDANTLLQQGWLRKKHHNDAHRVWRPRWVLLVAHWTTHGDDCGPALRYYSKQGDPHQGGSVVLLDGCVVREVWRKDKPASEFHFCVYFGSTARSLSIEGGEVVLNLMARTEEERTTWVTKMNAAIEDHVNDLAHDSPTTQTHRRSSIARARNLEYGDDDDVEDEPVRGAVQTPRAAPQRNLVSPKGNPAASCVLRGLLKKKGSGKADIFSRRSWKTRHFELRSHYEYGGTEIGPALLYFVTERDLSHPIAVISLLDCELYEREVDWRKHEHFGFDLVYSDDPLHEQTRELAALSSESREQWMAALLRLMTPASSQQPRDRRVSIDRVRLAERQADAQDHEDEDVESSDDESVASSVRVKKVTPSPSPSPTVPLKKKQTTQVIAKKKHAAPPAPQPNGQPGQRLVTSTMTTTSQRMVTTTRKKKQAQQQKKDREQSSPEAIRKKKKKPAPNAAWASSDEEEETEEEESDESTVEEEQQQFQRSSPIKAMLPQHRGEVYSAMSRTTWSELLERLSMRSPRTKRLSVEVTGEPGIELGIEEGQWVVVRRVWRSSPLHGIVLPTDQLVRVDRRTVKSLLTEQRWSLPQDLSKLQRFISSRTQPVQLDFACRFGRQVEGMKAVALEECTLRAFRVWRGATLRAGLHMLSKKKHQSPTKTRRHVDEDHVMVVASSSSSSSCLMNNDYRRSRVDELDECAARVAALKFAPEQIKNSSPQTLTKQRMIQAQLGELLEEKSRLENRLGTVQHEIGRLRGMLGSHNYQHRKPRAAPRPRQQPASRNDFHLEGDYDRY